MSDDSLEKHKEELEKEEQPKELITIVSKKIKRTVKPLKIPKKKEVTVKRRRNRSLL